MKHAKIKQKGKIYIKKQSILINKNQYWLCVALKLQSYL